MKISWGQSLSISIASHRVNNFVPRALFLQNARTTQLSPLASFQFDS